MTTRAALPRRWFLLPLLIGLVAGPALAQPYLSSGLGAHVAAPLEVAGQSNDKASYCDEYFNPHYALIEPCLRPGGGMWRLDFGGAAGVHAETAVGYRIGRRFRVEGEYVFRSSGYDQFAPAMSADRTIFGKLDGEIVRAEEYVGDLNAHGAFVNAYVDFPNASRFTPYAGAGAGVGFHEMDYGAVWARNLDPAQITSGRELNIPDYERFRSTLAGTVTTHHDQFTAALAGWQVLAGGDVALSDAVSLGVKARWVRFRRLAIEEPRGWDQLRSHASNIRLDGSEPATFRLETDDVGWIGVNLVLKYTF